MRAEVKAPPKPERRVSFGRWTQIVLFASVLMAALSGATFAFASSYFIVSVRSQQGDAVAQARALLHRDGRKWPTVVWQVLE